MMGTIAGPEVTKTITGVVTDETGAPLPGVSVITKNKGNGVVTDLNGKYMIVVNDSDKVLEFLFIGYIKKTENIGTRSVINVQMFPDNMALDEVVVVAYGTEMEGRVSGISARREKKDASSSYYSPAPQNSLPGRYNNNFNTEGYTTIHENGFKDVMNAPLSTFSIDVDRASYANIRRFINQGSLPPADAVRIEEMVNYFKYDYPQPVGEHPFSVYTEAAVCPWDNSHYLLHVGLKGKEIDKRELPPSNLVLLIDVSGSMESPNKLPLLKSAFTLLVNELRPQDRVAIVVYAGAAGVVLEPTPGNHKERILQAIERLNAGGSTAGGTGNNASL